MNTPTIIKTENQESVPFLDLRVLDQKIRSRYLERINAILLCGKILNGPEIEEFEANVASYCGTKFAIGVGSGTDALVLALKALGIGVGDEVIVPCLSFVGTANAISMVGATPVFVDIKKDLLIDTSKIAEKVTARTKAVMPVHFTGKLCDMVALKKESERLGLPIIEDAAPAFGASYNDKKAGSFGIVGCLSMNPMKILNACGEAGVVLTNDATIKEKLLTLRYHGMVDKEFCHEVSHNARIDTIQAAILLERLASIETTINKRREIAHRYNEAFKDLVYVPVENVGYKNVFYTYTIQTEKRDKLAEFLLKRRVEVKCYHRLLMPDQPFYLKQKQAESYPVGELAVKQLLCLPMHEKLSDVQVDYVINSVKEFFKEN